MIALLLRVSMVFIDRDGERHEVEGKVGDNVLYLAHRYGIEMEGVPNAPPPPAPPLSLSLPPLHLPFLVFPSSLIVSFYILVRYQRHCIYTVHLQYTVRACMYIHTYIHIRFL